MAYSLVAAVAQASIDSVGFTTSPINTTGATLLVFCRTLYDARSEGGIQDSYNNTWIELTRYEGSPAIVHAFYVLNPIVGPGHTFTGNEPIINYPDYFITAWGGVASPIFDQQTGTINNSGATQQAGSITPTESNELFIAFVSDCLATGGGQTPPVDYNLIGSFFFNPGQNIAGSMAYKIKTDASAENPIYTGLNNGANNSAMTLFSFKGAAVSGSSLFRPPSLKGIGIGGPFFGDPLQQ